MNAILLRVGAFGWVGLLVVLPVAALVVKGLSGGPGAFVEAITASSAIDALLLSLSTALIAALLNGIVGTILAWVLVRWDVPGRKLMGALIDLPLAIPTLVAGVLIITLFGPQTPVGRALIAIGLPVAFSKIGIILALLFVTLPFVVRAVEPVLEELDPAEEEAAYTMGATPWMTLTRVLLPPVFPAIAAGTIQTFARSVAEFGSLAAVSGNIPHQTLVAPVYILGEVEAGNPTGAAAVSLVLLAIALVLQPLSAWIIRRAGGRHV